MASKKSISESLLKELREKGADAEFFKDLLRDYTDLWQTKNDLIKDIKTRGVVYNGLSSVGILMMKNNPSVKELVMVNRQMLSILKELGLSTSSSAPVENDPL